MKNIITIASLAGAACAIPTTRRSGVEDTSSSLALRQTSAFPSASGTSFVIDGEQQYFAGTNTYWIGFQTNNADVDLVMKNIAGSGMKVLRVWGFNDVTSATDQVYYQSFINGEAKINTGANGLERLDYVVKSTAPSSSSTSSTTGPTTAAWQRTSHTPVSRPMRSGTRARRPRLNTRHTSKLW
jgi:mannan endo-1,4-beta-mannosidase